MRLRASGCSSSSRRGRGLVHARVVFRQDRLTRHSKRSAEVVNHGGHQRRDTAGPINPGKATPMAVRRPRPPQATPVVPPGEVRQVPAERDADRGTQLPVEGGQQVVIQHVSVDAHMVRELGNVSALPGEHHLSRGVVHAREGRPQSQPRTDSQAGVDLLAGAKGGVQRGRARILVEDEDCVVNVRSVPAQKLVRALRWAQEFCS